MASTGRRAAFLVSATLLIGVAIGFEPAVMRDLSVREAGWRASVGAVRVSLWSAAFAQSADSITLDNVTFSIGPDTFRAPRIEISGLTSTRADLEALLAPNPGEPLADRLAKISAREVRIPEMTSERQAGDSHQASVYRNITVSDISQGRMARMIAESSSIEIKGPKQNAVITQGRTSADDVDAVSAARVYTEKTGPQP